MVPRSAVLTFDPNPEFWRYIWYLRQETLQNLTKSVEIQRRFRKASVQLTAGLQYYFHREYLPFPRNETSLSADLSLQS